ncbi:hypothetical protein ACFL6C_07595 [Myxococcota bacterium]
MKTFAASVGTIAAAVSMLAVPVGSAHACSCAQPGTPEEALAASDAVFRGKVTEIDKASAGCGGEMSSADPDYVTLDVSTVWKGEVGKTTEVTTATSDASCGYTFDLNEEYIVYAKAGSDDLHVSLCSRTRPVSEASEDLAELGSGTMAALEIRRIASARLAQVGVLPILLLVVGGFAARKRLL